jgi:hypothetical protein
MPAPLHRTIGSNQCRRWGQILQTSWKNYQVAGWENYQVVGWENYRVRERNKGRPLPAEEVCRFLIPLFAA